MLALVAGEDSVGMVKHGEGLGEIWETREALVVLTGPVPPLVPALS